MADDRPSPRPLWMFALFGIAVLVGLFNVGAYVYGLTLPDEWSVDESVVIAAPTQHVLPFVSTSRRWTEWSSWSAERDPTAEFAFQGPESGKDAAFSWLGEQLGRGTLTIIESSPSEVRYKLELQGETFSEDGRVTFEPAEGGTRVRWTDGGEVNGTLGRFFRERLEGSVAADFSQSLQQLKRLVETEHIAAPADATPPSDGP